MVEIHFFVETKKDFITITHGIAVRDIHPDTFAILLRVFTEHEPHLLPGETLAPSCSTLKPNRKGVFIQSDRFKTAVSNDGACMVYCQYETHHPDGTRIHSYLLNVSD